MMRWLSRTRSSARARWSRLVPVAAATGVSLFGAVLLAGGQLTANPLPERISKRGLAVRIEDRVQLPDTRPASQTDREFDPPVWARVGYVRDLPDGRRFVNDLRGFIYLLAANRPASTYMNFAERFPNLYFNRLEGGLIAFTFHPEFQRNGLFYTIHTELGPNNPAVPDFVPPGFATKDVTYHNIVTEWRASNPSSNTFAGTHRELLRTADVVRNLTHPLGDLEFNPNARPGASDYGLLYISGSDHGFSNGGGPNASAPAQTQRLDSLTTALLRIDPRSPSETHGTKGIGDYTVPQGNRFARDGNPFTLGEIYAYGFRNAHRFSWDRDGVMFASEIGMNQVEEIDIVHDGGNYGWMLREGLFSNGRWLGGELRELRPLPDDISSGRTKDGLTYPVAVFDHDDGRAVSGGFAYRGAIEALRGKFVFGDLVNGRLFASDVAEMKRADDGVPRTVAAIEEIQLYVRDAQGQRTDVSLLDLIERTLGRRPARADLNISISGRGELLLGTRQDGMLRELVPDPGALDASTARAR